LTLFEENGEDMKKKIGFKIFPAAVIFMAAVFLSGANAQEVAPIEESPVLNGVFSWLPMEKDCKGIGAMDLIDHAATAYGPMPVPDRNGKEGGAMYFDGKDDFIDWFVNLNPNVMPRISIAVWFKTETLQISRTILSHDNGYYDRTIILDGRSGTYGISGFGGPTVQVFGGIPVPRNQWRLAVVTWDSEKREAVIAAKDSSNILRIIKKESADPGEGLYTTTLGKNPTFKEFFQGTIDEAVLWNRVLSENEIRALFSSDIINSKARKEARDLFNEGFELLKVGFYDRGVSMVKESIAKSGVKLGYTLNSLNYFSMDNKVPLEYLADIFAYEYRLFISPKMAGKPGTSLNAENKQSLNYAITRLFEYGIVAAGAGYPALTRQAALFMDDIGKKYSASLLMDYVNEQAALLNALAVACESGSEAGFNELIKFGRLKRTVYRVKNVNYRNYFAPFYENPKKLAYFLGDTEEALKKVKLDKIKKSKKFFDLFGHPVSASGSVPALEQKGAPVSIPASPGNSQKPVGTVLD